MKTILAKCIMPAVLLAFIFFLASFRNPKTQNKSELSEINLIASEYSQVRDFINKHINSPISIADDDKMSYRNFSRCPSGYKTYISSEADSVKLAKDVIGEIRVYKGCSGEYVCDYKVNVSKNLALVKTKEMSEYMSVAQFIELRKKSKPALDKGEDSKPAEKKEERAKEIKG